MDTYFTYILLGLTAVLLAIVIVMLVQMNRLKDNLEDVSRQSELYDQMNQQNLYNVQQTVIGVQAAMQQNMQGVQNAVQQSLSQNYTSLNQNLDSKLSGSFETINSYLRLMNRDLGEMKSVADGVEDLRKVLNNVKNRGILGEYQLGALLREVLAPSQYEENVATVPGSSERVEYAVKLPGNEFPVYLPIDSKFPGDAYAHLVEAYEASDGAAVDGCRKILVGQFKKEARDIRNKYVKIPYTTDFAVMFLPFEGLYAEAVNLGMIETLMTEYSVVIAGPSTMSALLSSLQMGFKTLAVQENADKVWKVLGEVKSEFDKFAGILDDTQDKLGKVSADLDKLVGVRTKKILRALSDVQNPGEEALTDFSDSRKLF